MIVLISKISMRTRAGQGAFIDEDDDLKPNCFRDCNSHGNIASEIGPSFPAASAPLMISKSIAS